MRRLPPVLRVIAALALLGSALGWAGPADLVYQQTAHGSASAGVARVPGLMQGNCNHCHALRTATASPRLFGPNDNTLCFTCHTTTLGAFQGRGVFEATLHWTSNRMLWPGPAPAARPAGDVGKCVNCHTPHGAKDGLGLVPDLGFTREETLCLACHDGNGPSQVNIAAELQKAAVHPIATITGRHVAGESGAAAFSGANRHVECVDCHNPHAAKQGGAPGFSNTLLNVSRVTVANGAANSAPGYTFLPASDATPAQEWQVCLKCHSGYAGTLPAGARDKGLELNPANASFHPVEAAGTNATAAMAASLAGGTGNPKLTPTSTLWCSDCHSSEAITGAVSTVSAWTGAAPAGPHGSGAAAGSATASQALLRAAYRVVEYPAGTPYAAADFAFCFICHSAAPFSDTSKSTRADTNYRLHGFHMRGITGSGNAICKDCHESIHGTATASQATQRTDARLVAFWPTLTSPAGGAPAWSAAGQSCTVRCHGMSHNPETY